MASDGVLDSRVPIAAGFAFLGLSAVLSAAVGLPLYEDGALYFLEILLERQPLVPNQRFGAVIPQLPLVVAMDITDQVIFLRHVFSLGYGLLPLLSALLCWLVVRDSERELMIFPTLFLAANQINFSAVSELLLSLYLAWPFLLLFSTRPTTSTTMVVGAALAPLLFFLHPLSFLLLFFLGVLLLICPSDGGRESRARRSLAVLFMGLGLVRLLWALSSVNAYERSYLDSGSAAYYLFPDSSIQAAFLCSILLLGLATAARYWRASSTVRHQDAHRGPGSGGEPALNHGLRLLPETPWFSWTLAASTAVLGLAVAAQIHAGEGIKLKSAVVFPLALALMAITVAAAGHARFQQSRTAWIPLFFLITLVYLLMGFSKAHGWQRATDDLAAAMAASPSPCVRLGPDEPLVLQSARMSAVDNWTAPIAALIFQTEKPATLLLPGDGCQTLVEKRVAYFTPWFARPLGALEARFGPIRVDQ